MADEQELLVVGSIGIDTIETPHGNVDSVLGGSCIYFACAASNFCRVNLVGVVGTDFPDEDRAVLEERNIDLDGLEVQEGKTFRWTGRYADDMNSRETLDTQLNVFGEFQPKVPEHYRDSTYLFLANGVPDIQASVLDQVKKPAFTMLDTMDLWMNISLDSLTALLKRVDALVINDEEAQQLSGKTNLQDAARDILKMGPETLIIKKGSHGSVLVQEEGYFALPAFPLESVIDPTGAGDSFAGALMGYVTATHDTSHENLRRAVAYGTVTAAYTCEGFSVDALRKNTRADLDARFEQLAKMVHLP
jgi:sugar/nucleoside kinase (ribokinase family)